MRPLFVIPLALFLLLVFLTPSYLLRLADPYAGPLKAVARPPPPVPLENYTVWVRAGDEGEAFYLLGRAHAYYRLFQMDVMRRAVEGRLAELVGDAGLPSDRYFRARGLHLWAERTWEELRAREPRLAYLLEQYTRGVNDEAARWLPLEYRVLGKRWEPWRPADSLAIGKLIAWGLSGGETDLELARLLQAAGDRAPQLLQIALTRRDSTPILPYRVEIPVAPGLLNVTEALPRFEAASSPAWTALSAPLAEASNNWVVSGRLTATGRPILANDPHLQLSAPPIWIFQYVDSLGYRAAGVAFPGVPLVVIGTNGRVAWGFTNTGVDVIDYYYYVWNGTRYYHGGRWLEAGRRVEEIRSCDLNGACRAELLEVLETVHGPVVEYGGQRFAMRWLGNNVTYEAVALYYMAKAADMDQFLSALRYFVVPSQNVVYADADGHVAYFASGYFPVRANCPSAYRLGGVVAPVQGPAGCGYLPLNGSRGEGEWAGLIWLPQHVRYLDPPYIATANNKLAESNAYLQLEAADRYRHDRIVQLLADASSRGALDVRDIMRIQLDAVDISCIDVRQLLASGGEAAREFARQLEGWNCTMDRGSVAAARYAVFLTELQRSWARYNASGLPVPLGITLEALRLGILGPDALEAAAREALQVNSTWGAMHRYGISHPLGVVLPQLNYPALPASGDWFTVNVAPEFSVSHGPSVRFIAAFGDGIYFALPGGPDGDPLSPLYAALFYLWYGGRYVKLPMPTGP